MLEKLLDDPMFYFAVFAFIFVMAYFYWIENREKERKLEERMKQLEKKLEEQQKNSQK